jgi:hypothetical protein
MEFHIDDPRTIIENYKSPAFEDTYGFSAVNQFGNPMIFFTRSTTAGAGNTRFLVDDQSGEISLVTGLELLLQGDNPQAVLQTFGRTEASMDFNISLGTIPEIEQERSVAYLSSMRTILSASRATREGYDSESIFWFHSPAFGAYSNVSLDDRMDELLSKHEGWVSHKARGNQKKEAKLTEEPTTKPAGCASIILLLVTLTPVVTFGAYHLLNV